MDGAKNGSTWIHRNLLFNFNRHERAIHGGHCRALVGNGVGWVYSGRSFFPRLTPETKHNMRNIMHGRFPIAIIKFFILCFVSTSKICVGNVGFMLINASRGALYLTTHACLLLVRAANLSPSLCWCFTFHITNNGITVNMKMTKPKRLMMPFSRSFFSRSLPKAHDRLVTLANPSFISSSSSSRSRAVYASCCENVFSFPQSLNVPLINVWPLIIDRTVFDDYEIMRMLLETLLFKQSFWNSLFTCVISMIRFLLRKYIQ